MAVGGTTLKRRNILIFRNELLPSSETFILAQANALSRFRAVFAGVHPATHSLRLPRPILLTQSSSLRGKIVRRIFWRFGWAPQFMARLSGKAPCLIHAHFALDGAAALPIRRHLDIPLVVTLHGYDVTSSDDALRQSPEGRTYLRNRAELWSRAAVFLCISEFIRDRALALGFPPEKLRVLYTGTDFSLFTPGDTARDPNMILFVGRLVEKKGVHHLLDALAIVRKRLPLAHLVMIGGGTLEESVRQRVAAEDLPCTLLGRQPAEVVKDYMARARVFSAPSIEAAHGDCEGLGMVFIEAQAMGTPVASFAHGGIPEAVLDGKTGLLAREGDSAGLADNLFRLLDDGRLWLSLSRAGIDFVHRSFDIRMQTQALEDVYTSLCEQHHPRKLRG